MLELLRDNNVDFDRNAAVTLVGWALLSGLCALSIRRLLALDALTKAARRGTWPEGTRLTASRLPAWVAAACVCLVSLLHAQTIATARALFPILPPPVMKPGGLAEVMALSLARQLHAFAMSNLTLPIVLLTGVVSVALAICVRQRALGLQTALQLSQAGDHTSASAWLSHPGPNPVVAIAIPMLPLTLTLLPLWHGLHQFVSRFVIALGRTANLPAGADRGGFMRVASNEYRAWIEPTLSIAFVGLAVGTIAAFALLLRFDPTRRRRALVPDVASGASSAVASWGSACIMLAIAAVLAHRTAPLRDENTMPWPRDERAGVVARLGIDTPPFQPDDVAKVAPVLSVDATRLLLDGRSVDLAGLEGDLGILKRHWSGLHPDEAFEANVIVACSPETEASRIVEALLAAQRAGYAQAWFAFGRTLRQRRPVLGTLEVARTRYARAELLPNADAPAGDGAPPIVAAAQGNCLELSRAVVAMREKKEAARLSLAR